MCSTSSFRTTTLINFTYTGVAFVLVALLVPAYVEAGKRKNRHWEEHGRNGRHDRRKQRALADNTGAESRRFQREPALRGRRNDSRDEPASRLAHGVEKKKGTVNHRTTRALVGNRPCHTTTSVGRQSARSPGSGVASRVPFPPTSPLLRSTLFCCFFRCDGKRPDLQRNPPNERATGPRKGMGMRGESLEEARWEQGPSPVVPFPDECGWWLGIVGEGVVVVEKRRWRNASSLLPCSFLSLFPKRGGKWIGENGKWEAIALGIFLPRRNETKRLRKPCDPLSSHLFPAAKADGPRTLSYNTGIAAKQRGDSSMFFGSLTSVVGAVVDGSGNFDNLGFFNVHPNLSTRAYTVSASIENAVAAAAGIRSRDLQVSSRQLGFNPNLKVNLQDLTAQLEEEMASVSAGNASTTYAFALASYQHELTHLKTNFEQAREERDRLRVNVAEANARSALIAQEVDEHHAKMEKGLREQAASVRIGRGRTLEKRHTEQLREVTEELQRERETTTLQLTRLRQRSEDELSALRAEELRLRAQVATLEQENHRLELEVQEYSERYRELHRLGESQQKELESVAQLKQKELKDSNDELTLELETLRQQLNSSSTSRSSAHGKRHRRSGSWVSDYSRQGGLKRRGSEASSSVYSTFSSNGGGGGGGRKFKREDREVSQFLDRLATLCWGKGRSRTDDIPIAGKIRRRAGFSVNAGSEAAVCIVCILLPCSITADRGAAVLPIAAFRPLHSFS
ncbi:hypothetical protein HPB51_001459 [Rhipicephalus microplus]|uniref:Uncharacterized protein n=1 Tax=Rhipicephalus microplus TaxID=6941 RepID=A0A9J6DXR9_RHIMP|nr:hypothetical protein HPB51_001459 [Rhipicephalus microplus]